jgi:hypothetical protein
VILPRLDSLKQQRDTPKIKKGKKLAKKAKNCKNLVMALKSLNKKGTILVKLITFMALGTSGLILNYSLQDQGQPIAGALVALAFIGLGFTNLIATKEGNN